MGAYRQEKIEQLIGEFAAKYIERESNHTSLITVTRVVLAERNNKASVLISVLPESAEEVALNFLKRHRAEIKDYIQKHARIGRMPLIDIDIDKGEKMRQKIDALSQE